jgi:GAF domain-containing protein
LKIGEEGIVGNVVGTGEAHIALDVGVDAVHFKNPLLPNTRSEMALPLHVGGRVIGALDIQSEEESAFTQENVNVLGSVADQLAVAVERSKLLKQWEQSRVELETGYQQYALEVWQSYFRKTQSSLAFQYSHEGVQQNESMPPESLQALIKGEVVVQPVMISKDGIEKRSTVLAVPIRLRNQVLGVLNLNLDESASTEDMQTLAEAASSRLALALENARLLEQLQFRVEQEHLVSDITSKLRGATDVNELLRTTAIELGRSLGVSEVRVQLLTSKEE